jgi:hypothetical protein
VWQPEITVDHALETDQPGGLVDVLSVSAWALPDAYPPEVAASSPQLAQREPQLANDPIGAWASDGVEQILRTVTRIGARRPGGLGVAGIVVNRLGRTRDAKYWYQQLVETYSDQVLPPVRLRAAIPEAAAQSLPIHGLGARAGAAEAAAEFDALLAAIFPELAGSAPVDEELEELIDGSVAVEIDEPDEIELVDEIELTDEADLVPNEIDSDEAEPAESVEAVAHTNGHATQPVGSVADGAGWTA